MDQRLSVRGKNLVEVSKISLSGSLLGLFFDGYDLNFEAFACKLYDAIP